MKSPRRPAWPPDGVEAVRAVERERQVLVEPERAAGRCAAPRAGRQRPKAPARSESSPNLAMMPGSTPNSTVQHAGDGERGRRAGAGTLMGVVSPSGTGFIHISRMTHDVVRRRDDGVDGADDGDAVAPAAAGVDDRPERTELGVPAAERRDAGERGEEDRHHHGEARGVGEQAAEAADLAAAGLARRRR